MSPFDFLNAINYTKENLIVDDLSEKEYNGFMVNRGLSYFNDTAIIANEMNVNPHIDSKMQFDFLQNMIRKRKRWSKWMKPSKEKYLECVKAYYGYSDEKAAVALSILTEEQLIEIEKITNRGGRKR